MDIYEKIKDFVSIIMLTIQGIVYLLYEKLKELLIKIPDETKIMNANANANANNSMGIEKPDYERYRSNTNTNDGDSSGNERVAYNLYKPDDILAVNDNDYTKYSILDIIPDNIVMPNNYKATTEEFEAKNTEYDYKDYSNVDGAGVHLQRGWSELSSINRPWFETCLSDMDCKVVEGSLEKFDYQK